MNENSGYIVLTLTGSGPTWNLVSAKGITVYTIVSCPRKQEALEQARKWASSWYNYRVEDGTDGAEKK